MTTPDHFAAYYNGNGRSPVVGAQDVARAHGLTDHQFEELQSMAANVLTSRLDWITQQAGLDGRRNLDKECGFPERDLSPHEYQRLFEDDPFAARTIEVMPKEMWQVTPWVYEKEAQKATTKFEKAFLDLSSQMGTPGIKSFLDTEDAHPLWGHLLRADIMSGIGRYGVIVVGINDGRPLSEPVRGVEERGTFPVGFDPIGDPTGEDDPTPRARKLVGTRPSLNDRIPYSFTVNAQEAKGNKLSSVRVFSEYEAPIIRWESNPRSPRYRYPTMYQITFEEDAGPYGSGEGLIAQTLDVHWTRVIHVADTYETASSSDLMAVPRVKPVRKILLDFPKLLYGGAEGYWKACVNLIALETIPALGGNVKLDRSAVRDMMEKVMNSMQRYVVGSGFTFKTLAPTVTDPTPHVESHIAAICIKKGIPVRVFKGSERGELASSQDDAAWNDRLKGRMTAYATPRLIGPVIDRLIALKVLPEPETGKFRCDWPDLTSETSGEKITVAAGVTEALSKYVSSGISQVMAPVDFLTRVLWFDEDEAQAIIDGAAEYTEEKEALDMEKREEEIDRGLAPDPQAPPPPGDGGPPEEVGASARPKPPQPTPAGNAFCPTGPGGGVDPTCSPKGSGGSSSRVGKIKAKARALAQKMLEKQVEYTNKVLDLLPDRERFALDYSTGGRVGTVAKIIEHAAGVDHTVATVAAQIALNLTPAVAAKAKRGVKSLKARISKKREEQAKAKKVKRLKTKTKRKGVREKRKRTRVHNAVANYTGEGNTMVVNARYEGRLDMTVPSNVSKIASCLNEYAGNDEDQQLMTVFLGVAGTEVADVDEVIRLSKEALTEAKIEGLTVDDVVDNVFCPTGKGGGIDPTCSPGGKGGKGGRGGRKKVVSAKKNVYRPNVESDKNRDGVTDAARVGVKADDVPPPPTIGRLPNLHTRGRKAEEAFIKAYEKNPERVAGNFRRMVHNAKKEGDPPTFGTDDAKALTTAWNHPDKNKRATNRATLNLALHQTANAIAKRAFLQELDGLRKGDEIMVTVGGVGCHEADTPIMMADGSLKLVQDVEVGDCLMGPDSKPRKVLRLIRGTGRMYDVIPKKGRSFRVNGDHVLSLMTTRGPGTRKRTKKVRVEMTVEQYLSKAKNFRVSCLLHRTGVDFSYVPVALDPYFLGVWLGDGCHSLAAVSTADEEIAEYVREFSSTFPAVEVIKNDKTPYRGRPNQSKEYRIALLNKFPGKGTVNPVVSLLKEVGVWKNKHIPDAYLKNDRNTRLQLLAGLIDTDGGLNRNCFDWLSKSERMAYDVAYLARSVGLAAYVKPRWVETEFTNGEAKCYWRVVIHGDIDMIPTRVLRKKPSPRRINKNALHVGFRVEPSGVDQFYGFTLEGDGLYLLDDFTVTHNSGKGYALKQIPEALAAKQRAKVVWDSAGDQNATENPWIQREAEKRGLKVNYVYVNADPKVSWAHPKAGVMQRAASPDDGRMVDAKVFADSYAIGARNHHAFAQKNKKNPNASFMFIQNTVGEAPALLPGVPAKARRLNRKALAKFAMDEVKKARVPRRVKRGATMGQDVWSD